MIDGATPHLFDEGWVICNNGNPREERMLVQRECDEGVVVGAEAGAACHSNQ